MSFAKVVNCIGGLAGDGTHYPLTEVLNEQWLLRLVLQWYSEHVDSTWQQKKETSALRFQEGETWFSEAIPPTPFGRQAGAAVYDGPTHLDGVIGKRERCEGTAAKLCVRPDATRLVVIEAKVTAAIGGATTHAPVVNGNAYDQMSRITICALWALWRPEDGDGGAMRPLARSDLDVLLIAPEDGCHHSIGEFRNRPRDAQIARVRESLKAWNAHRALPTAWFEQAIECLEHRTTFGTVSWEDIADDIEGADKKEGKSFRDCLEKVLAAYNGGNP